MSFFEKLESAIASHQSWLVVALDPNPETSPAEGDWWEWLQWVIDQTGDRVCAYKPTLGYYLALGAPGLELLARVLEAIPENVPAILDAKHGDLNSSTVLAKTVFEQWGADAITLNPYAGQDQIAPFLLYSDKAVFVSCCTSNPAADLIQGYPGSDDLPLYLHVAAKACHWGTPQQLALEVGTSHPEVLAKVRAIAPERLILARSIWAAADRAIEGRQPRSSGRLKCEPRTEPSGTATQVRRQEEGSRRANRELLGDIAPVLKAGLNANGEGLLIPVSVETLKRDDLGEAIAELNRGIERVRSEVMQANASHCDMWMPDVCLLERHPHQELILQLFDLECVLFGEFVQASGDVFPYYIDLRKIVSNPQVFERVINAYESLLAPLEFDRLAGIPYGALPTATGLSLRLQKPMIYPRKEVKAHGTRRTIEGHFETGETVVVVDDILISGRSATEGAQKLQAAGLDVKDIVVLIDHSGSANERLQATGYRAHSVLSLPEIAKTLYAAGRIDEAQLQAIVSDR